MDWFAGIGGFRLGLERAGHQSVGACELAAFPRRVYAERFGHDQELEDITHVDPADVPQADLWTAGFPCQDLSSSGGRGGIDGSRSGLVWRLLELAAEIQPRWLLLENVQGLVSSDRGHGFGRLLAELGDLGYGWAYRRLDAQFFGLAQHRERYFVVASRLGTRAAGEVLLEHQGRSWNSPARRCAGEEVAYTITTRPGDRHSAEDNYVVGSFDSRGGHGKAGAGWRDDGSTGTVRCRAAGPPAVVLSFDPTHEWVVRRLTPLECERLQGFPDGWTDLEGASDSARYEALGNAVPPPVVEWIARRFPAEA